MRLAGKIAVIVGAGQSPGEGIGNGRATVLRFAQEGAKILAVDRDLASAEETAVLAAKSGGECVAFQADVTREATLAAAMAAAVERWGRIDILHNNVGVSIAGGDKPLDELTEESFDRVSAINLRGTIMACKHVLPVMRRQRSGAIVNISSVAAYENSYPLVAYKATKGDRDRKYAADHGDTGSVGAADRHRRGIAGHQLLARQPCAGVRRDPRKSAQPVRRPYWWPDAL
jgi:NAD(P)-dependent dehydrogenase (short-subunit alcohol dehydrogenase family)